MNPVITLTTDLGLKDYYSAALKGKILSIINNANIIDITHQVKPFDPYNGAFILNQTFRFFPKKSLHLLLVGNQGRNNCPLIIAKFNQHYFIGYDNGAFSKIFDVVPDWIHQIEIKAMEYANSFSAIQYIGQIIKTLIESDFEEIPGIKISDIQRKQFIGGFTNSDTINGIVTHIDSFENIITDIHRELFYSVSKNRHFSLQIKQFEVHKINKNYDDVPTGELVLLFNTLGFLEIALNNGNASSLLAIKPNDNIRINFID